MRLQLYEIMPALQPYIKLICTMECEDEADTNYVRVLPDACVELFINYTSKPVAMIDKEVHRSSIVSFRMTKPNDVQMRKGSGCLAVCLWPGMAYNFFKIPLHLVSNTTTPLSDLWGKAAVELENRLAHAADNSSRVDIVQKYLLQLVSSEKNDLHLERCLKRVQASHEPVTVNELTYLTGISQRHLSRKFQNQVGMSPIEYLRVNRFLRSLSFLRKYPHLSLTSIAYESGYYDQSHFNRDYKAYTGYSPREVANARHILY